MIPLAPRDVGRPQSDNEFATRPVPLSELFRAGLARTAVSDPVAKNVIA